MLKTQINLKSYMLKNVQTCTTRTQKAHIENRLRSIKYALNKHEKEGGLAFNFKQNLK